MNPDERKINFRFIKVIIDEFIEKTYKSTMKTNDNREMIKIYNTDNPLKIWNGITFKWNNILMEKGKTGE